MIKKGFPAALLLLCMLPILLAAFSPVAVASPMPGVFDVEVDHVVQIRNGGLVIINDTVRLAGRQGETALLQNFTLGFPYLYQPNLDYAFAYETSKPSSRLKLEHDVGMGIIGFYGVNVVFPQAVNISNGGEYEFSAVFVFSNRITVRSSQVGNETMNNYNASFPAYPSLFQLASQVNLAVLLPTGLDHTGDSFETQGINLTKTTSGSTQFFNYVKSNLSEFSYEPGWLGFTGSPTAFDVFEVLEVNRDIEFTGGQQITVLDNYRMINKADKLVTLNVNLPAGAYDITAYDEFGSISSSNLKIDQTGSSTNLSITFAMPYPKDKEALFSVQLKLPWKNYTNIESWNRFQSSLALYQNSDWTVRQLTASITLPEGASLVSQSASLNSLEANPFSTSFSLAFCNATPFNDLSFDFTFERVILWESFRPTLLMGSIVVVISAIVGAWHVYKPQAAPIQTAISRVRVEDLKKFVDSYDERRHYQREIESLEAQARKGKIPRRVYKVRRTSSEGRVASLSRDLATLREKIRTAGPRYADMMRQLEVAETELQGIEADVTRTEIRYRRGEISAAAYHKLLEDSYRRRDRAQVTIDGVLLRLKEELS